MWLTTIERSNVVAAGAIIVLALFVHYHLFPRVSDVDSFYHLRHSWVYRVYGLFDSSFPWAQFSSVKTQASDLWYGFHILTVPLTFFEPLTNGIHVGGLLITITSLSLAFVAFRRLNVPWALLWVVFFCLINPDVLYRLTMLRPHPLSLGLVLVLFSYMVTAKSRASLIAVFALAALFSWNHVVVFWIPAFMVAVVSGVRLLHRQPPEWGKLAAFAAGLVLGVLLRPNPLGVLQLVYSVTEMMLVKRNDVALNVGRELYPFYWEQFVGLFLPLTLLLLAGVGFIALLWWRGRFLEIDRDRRIAMGSSLALTVFFFVLTFTVARRSHELAVGFGTIFLALVLPYWRSLPAVPYASDWRPWRARSAKLSSAAKSVLVVAALSLVFVTYRNLQIYAAITENAFHPGKFRAVGEWLAKNAEPGEIVFHPHWDRFGELFFWNPRNYYINGMDPILHYTYDERSYWQAYYLAQDRGGKVTCGSFPCREEEAVFTYDALKHGFKASYLVLEKSRTPDVYAALLDLPGFTRILETDAGVVLFRVD